MEAVPAMCAPTRDTLGDAVADAWTLGSLYQSLANSVPDSIYACPNVARILRKDLSPSVSGTALSLRTLVTKDAVTIGRAHSFRQ